MCIIVGEKEKEQLTNPEASHSADTSQATDAAPTQLSKSARQKQKKRALKQTESATSAKVSEGDKGAQEDVASNQPTGTASSADPSSSRSTQVKLKICFVLIGSHS